MFLLFTLANLTFFVSLSTRSEGYPLSKNHDFILPRCLTKSDSQEDILLILSAWLKTVERLVYSGCEDV